MTAGQLVSSARPQFDSHVLNHRGATAMAKMDVWAGILERVALFVTITSRDVNSLSSLVAWQVLGGIGIV
jgi:hypothetical protein